MSNTTVINLTWQAGHDGEALSHACADADVVLVCEVRGPNGEILDLRPLLPDGWATNQDLTGRDKSMTAVCWRTATTALVEKHEPVLLSRAGRRVRGRYLSNVDLRDRRSGRTRRHGAAHAPLLATGRKGEWYRTLRTWLISHPQAVVGADGNQRLMRRVARLLGRQVVGREVMFLTVPRNQHPAGVTTTRTRGSDHPILRVLLRARPRRRKKKGTRR